MTSREIVLANLNHTNPPRPGMNFDGGRMDDFLSMGPGASRSYTPKRWIEGNKEYYDDEWGNVWARMVGGSVKGEIHQAFLSDWRRLDDLRLPDYDDPIRWEEMRTRFSKEKDKFRLACIGGWIFDNARYLRKLEIYLLDMLMHSCGLNRDLLDDLIACGVDCFQFDQPALYDMPALAEKFKQRQVALWSPVDIQKILPTGNREYIESETDRMLQLFHGGRIMKNYPDLPGIGVKPEWDTWVYDRVLQSL